MASRWARIWCVRPGLQPDAQQRVVRERALDLEVRHRLARLVRVGRHARADAAVAAERRVDRAAPGGRAALDEGEVLAHEVAPPPAPPSARRARRLSGRRRAARRCRGRGGARSPGRAGSSPPAARPCQGLHERALAVPARRVHDHAGRLVDDQQVLVLVGDGVRRGRAAAGAAAAGAGSVTTSRSPPASTWRLGRRSPSTVTWPPSISRCAAAREPAWPARWTSSRSPAALAGTVSSGAIGGRGRLGRRGGRLLAAARRALEDVDQGQHAERDRHVGDVEGREVRELDEVRDRAGAGAVDQVADGAAEQQPGRRPTRARGPCASRRRRRARAARSRCRRRAARRRRRGSRTRCPSCARARGRARRGPGRAARRSRARRGRAPS